jgi:phosphorylase kinase alpha/beta subunit
MLDLLAEFKKGQLSSGLNIKTGRLQNMISSSCIEHLDFLHLLREDSLPRFDPLKQLEHTINAGYQSLTDIPKPEVYKETIDPNFTSKFANAPTWPALIDALKNTETLAGQSQLLALLWKREGPHFCLPEGATVKEKLEKLSRQAGCIRYWSVVRYCSSILKKLVDSLSPNITSVLVNGKQIAIGSFGGPEVVIDHPLTPKEIHSLLYNTISDPYEAVLAQEVVLYLGRLITTNPHLFQGILKIRIGSILQAMRLYNQFQGKDTKLEELSPSQIRKLMYRVLTDDGLDMMQKRQIEGALCRVPEEFYDKVWQILRRLPGGICIQGLLLTTSNMTTTKSNQYEMDFVLLVESILAKIGSPQYRQLNVELLVIIHLLLKRNPELYFPENVPIDLDQVIREAVAKFQEAKNDKGMEAFYAECSGNTASYLARTVAQTMFVDSSECKIN